MFMMRVRRLLVLVAGATIAVGCESYSPSDLDVLIPESGDFQGFRDGSKLTAVQRVLAHYGLDASATISTTVNGNSEQMNARELKDIFEAVGLEAIVFRGSFGDTATSLAYHIDRGRPLLALLQDDENPRRWVFVAGASRAKRLIAIRN